MVSQLFVQLIFPFLVLGDFLNPPNYDASSRESIPVWEVGQTQILAWDFKNLNFTPVGVAMVLWQGSQVAGSDPNSGTFLIHKDYTNPTSLSWTIPPLADDLKPSATYYLRMYEVDKSPTLFESVLFQINDNSTSSSSSSTTTATTLIATTSSQASPSATSSPSPQTTSSQFPTSTSTTSTSNTGSGPSSTTTLGLGLGLGLGIPILAALCVLIYLLLRKSRNQSAITAAIPAPEKRPDPGLFGFYSPRSPQMLSATDIKLNPGYAYQTERAELPGI